MELIDERGRHSPSPKRRRRLVRQAKRAAELMPISPELGLAMSTNQDNKRSGTPSRATTQCERGWAKIAAFIERGIRNTGRRK